jgi:hypothetical protein
MRVRIVLVTSIAAIALWMPDGHAQQQAKSNRVTKDMISRVVEIEACWESVNNSFPELQERLWLGTNPDKPPTPSQLSDHHGGTRRDRKVAMAWFEETRQCSSWGASLGDNLIAAYSDSRLAMVQMFAKGAPYDQVNENLYIAAKIFEDQFRADRLHAEGRKSAK